MADNKAELTLRSMNSFKGKDLHGPENSIPLSPQWLLPKPGENKLGVTTGVGMQEHPVNSSPGHGGRNEFLLKVSGNGEETSDMEKRKDIWRSTSVEAETMRREHWRDEERENTSVRRDRWKGEKESGEHRRTERWEDNLMGRSPGEIRRLTSDRWNDTGNRETNYEARRESKWDTRWGREDKDAENRREKWLEPGKDVEGQREKGLLTMSDIGKDSEKEIEHNPRPWRSNSLQNRARVEGSYLSTPTPNKHTQGFSFGRGRGDMASPGFTAGRGRGNHSANSLVSNSLNYNSLGGSSERWDTNLGNGSTLKYSRAKLLDIYRKCVMKPSFARPPDGFTETPSLTQGDTLEPLALSSPSSEEEATIEGINRGDIVSSGVPQYSKDGTLNRTREDVSNNQRQRPESRGDGASIMLSPREDNFSDSKVNNYNYKDTDIIDKGTNILLRDLKIGKIQEQQPLDGNDMDIEVSKNKDLHFKHKDDSSQGSTAHISGSWRSGGATEQMQGSLHDWQEIKSEIAYQKPDAKNAVWLKSGANRVHDHERNVPGIMVSTSSEDGMRLHLHEALQVDTHRLKHHPSMGSNRMLTAEGSYLDREKAGTREGTRHIPPEELSLFYRDPQGDIQGPFTGADMIGWYEAGYFGIDLPVRLESDSVDVPFKCLGDVMPHLRMKAKAPPGFGIPKQADATDVTIASKFGIHAKGQGNIIGSGFEISHNEQKGKMDTLEAEKSFMESLMNGTFKSPPPVEHVEGASHGFQGLGPGGTSSISAESGLDMNYGIGRRLSPYHSVDRQKSLSNRFPYAWSPGDTSSLAANNETITDTGKSLPQFTAMTSDASHNISHVNQHGDVMSILQSVSDSTVASPMNNAVNLWANYGDTQSRGAFGHGGLDIPHQDQVDMHHLQRFSPVQSGFPLQHQRQQQHQPLMQHLMSPSLENRSGGVPLEQLLPSALPQDLHTSNLLHHQQQQQLLLSQLQLRSQASLPSQVSLLEQILMLEQQKQQQQQQQQQQQLLPQVLLEQIAHQQRQESSYERAQAPGYVGNASTDHGMFRQPGDPFMVNAKLPQHVPPQPSVIDNLFNLINQQGSKGTNLSQQVELEGNLKLNKVASLTTQQTIAEFSQPSPVWGVSEQDKFDKIQASSFLPTREILEKVSKEQPMLHQSGIGTSNDPVSNLSSESNSQAVPQMEQILIDSVSSRNVNVTEKNTATNEVLSCVSSPLDGFSAEQVVEKFNQNEMDESKISVIDESTQQEKPARNNTQVSAETNLTEALEVKKSTEKKSRRQKSSKMSSERQKMQPDIINLAKQGTENSREVTQNLTSEDTNSLSVLNGPVLQLPTTQMLQAPMSTSSSGESLMVESTAAANADSQSKNMVIGSLSQRAWKPAPCPKPKSLLEIQEEEQKQKTESEKAVSEVPVLSTASSLSTPWAGAVIGSEKPLRDGQCEVNMAAASVLHSGSGNLDNGCVRTKKSNLHDLLAEEVLAKTSQPIPEASVADNIEKPCEAPMSSFLPPLEMSTADDSEFIEAKESKKNRKRANKGKNAAVAKGSTVASTETPVSSVLAEKSKAVRQIQQEKEVLSVPPSGPSLGDFLPWKTESSSSPPAPAWSVDKAKLTKTASLREIQKEQERKFALSMQSQQQVVVPPKVQASRSLGGNSSLWSVPKSATPTQSIAIPSSASRSKSEDELFWGPVNPMKQETERPEFPSLITGKSLTPKNSLIKASPELSSSRKSSAVLTANKSSNLPLPSSVKGKKQLFNKYSEAKDFHGWCEAELCRLIGNNDTKVLEYCLKQPTEEAKMLLVQNLGTSDTKEEFIDKVLKYKELLPADVIDMAFSQRDVQVQSSMHLQSQDANATDIHSRRSNLESRSGRDSDIFVIENEIDASARGGKKKGKKGKKVNPSVLGFSVESTRIMKGEIQSADD